MKFITYDNGMKRERSFAGPDSAVTGNSYDEIVFTRQDMLRLSKMLDYEREAAVELLQHLATRANYRIGRGIDPRDYGANAVNWKAQPDQHVIWASQYQSMAIEENPVQTQVLGDHDFRLRTGRCRVCDVAVGEVEAGTASKDCATEAAKRVNLPSTSSVRSVAIGYSMTGKPTVDYPPARVKFSEHKPQEPVKIAVDTSMERILR